jgi:hypothetical protein
MTKAKNFVEKKREIIDPILGRWTLAELFRVVMTVEADVHTI